MLREFIYPFINPMGLYFLVIVACFAIRRLLPKVSSRVVILISILFFAVSTKLVGQWLFHHVETIYPLTTVSSREESDYIVLLGGNIGAPEPPRLELEFGFMGDRILHAVRLFKAGKAPKIVVSGGNANAEYMLLSEAEYISQLLIELGVPKEAIVLESNSRNTRENALMTAKILNRQTAKRIILVTSALHMPRAYSNFSNVGFLSVEPAPADIYIPDRKEALWSRLLPSSTGLALSTNAIHEIVGQIVFKLRQKGVVLSEK